MFFNLFDILFLNFLIQYCSHTDFTYETLRNSKAYTIYLGGNIDPNGSIIEKRIIASIIFIKFMSTVLKIK